MFWLLWGHKKRAPSPALISQWRGKKATCERRQERPSQGWREEKAMPGRCLVWQSEWVSEWVRVQPTDTLRSRWMDLRAALSPLCFPSFPPQDPGHRNIALGILQPHMSRSDLSKTLAPNPIDTSYPGQCNVSKITMISGKHQGRERLVQEGFEREILTKEGSISCLNIFHGSRCSWFLSPLFGFVLLLCVLTSKNTEQ